MDLLRHVDPERWFDPHGRIISPGPSLVVLPGTGYVTLIYDSQRSLSTHPVLSQSVRKSHGFYAKYRWS